MATDLSVALGLLDAGARGRMRHLLVRCGLPTRAPDLGVDHYLALMGRDKKAQAGEIRFVVLEGWGRAGVRPAPDSLVAGVIERAVKG
jgi:3-dehydroquinate synthase